MGAPLLPPEVDSDEPAVFQQEGVRPKPKALVLEKVEEKKAVLMESDKPDYIPLFFAPEKNGVVYAHQEIEYDLTNPLILRVGPLSVAGAGVVMRLSRETGEFFDFDFGLSLQKKYANMYMVSFQWPVELVPDGVIELFNDDGQVLWRRPANEEHIAKWKKDVNKTEEERQRRIEEYKRATEKDPEKAKVKESTSADMARFQSLRITGHDQSSYGLFGKDIFDIPIWKMKEPFRFCVTKDAPEGRIAICSKRYRFKRQGGRFWIVAESKVIVPKVMVNDKEVTLKGSAVFIDDNKPIKFAALMSNGTYFEFISYPKRITIVDMVLNDDSNEVEVIGYGPPPLGPIQRIERIAPDYWDFLNFMPTIGDFRQFWKASFPAVERSVYLRGYGGAPFKQPFVYDQLPRKKIRPRIHIKSPKSTYSRTVLLKGETSLPARVSSKEESAKNETANSFTWDYWARNRGEMNQAELLVKDGKHTFTAFHEIYKGYPRELSTRLTGVVTSNLELVILGEVAAQMWFEKLLGWNNPTFSLQRWGLNAKYFQALSSVGGSNNGQSLIKLNVTTLDLKYRLTPGIWARDHTLGLMADIQQVEIERYKAQMGGGGLFWARSMPRFFDNIFNIIPFMRYPKWVDMEGILYFMPLSATNRLGLNVAVNFHGKVLWSERFFGEAGFGFKFFQFDDLVVRKSVGLGIAYGTLGIGLNF